MRVAMAVLADAVNMREGMLNVLSAGVSRLTRDAFPSSLGVDLALMIELTAEDVVSAGSVEVRVKLSDPEGAEVLNANGALEWGATESLEASSYLNLPLAFRDALIPMPGKYEFRIGVGNLEDITISFAAVELATANDSVQGAGDAG